MIVVFKTFPIKKKKNRSMNRGPFEKLKRYLRENNSDYLISFLLYFFFGNFFLLLFLRFSYTVFGLKEEKKKQ